LTPAPSGELRIAVSGSIRTLDPLLADDRAERIASRQIHEPLLSSLTGPFGQSRRLTGPARSFESSGGDTIWTARLRPRVKFQNGEPLDADAVRANAARWMLVPPGPELLPELAATDSPRPGLVRFLLDRPSPRFPKELADAHLGLVAPQALAGVGFAPVKLDAAGTGPFELREHGKGDTLLARNLSWWGADVGLGPGVEQIEMLEVDGGHRRADELIDGSVEVADGLGPATLRKIEREPLLATVRGGRRGLGIERSVRGIDSPDADQSLADAWLTDLR
jgi:peptide/nickel transport system substrate-binding protein